MQRAVLGCVALVCSVVFARPAAAEPPSSESAWSDPQFTWGVVATGAGAVMLGSGVYFWVRADQGASDASFEEYKKNQVSKGEDACDVAERDGRDDIVDLCESQRRNRVLGWVLVPLGLATTTTGIVLLATRDSSGSSAGVRRPRLVLTPYAGHDGGALRVRYAF